MKKRPKPTPEQRQKAVEEYERQKALPFKPKYKLGDLVYVTDQFVYSGPFEIIEVNRGDGCCEDNFDPYYAVSEPCNYEPGRKYLRIHHEEYVHTSISEAEIELEEWRITREKWKDRIKRMPK